MTLPPIFRQPLRPLSLPNALVSHSRPHPPLVGLISPPPATPTQLAKRKGKKELLRLHPHHLLTRSGPPPQLTLIFRDTTYKLPLPHYMGTLRHLPKNTPTPGKRKNSRKGNTPPAPPGPPVILTPTGILTPPWPPKPPPPTLKLSHPLLRERRVDRRRPLARLPPLRLRQVRFFTKSPPPLPQAVCRPFAFRTTFEPHPEALKIAAHFPDMAASVLREANCSLPVSFTCTVNDKGSESLLGTDLHTAAFA